MDIAIFFAPVVLVFGQYLFLGTRRTEPCRLCG